MKRAEVDNKAKILLHTLRKAMRAEAGPDADDALIDRAAVGRAVVALIEADVERGSKDPIGAILGGIVMTQQAAGFTEAEARFQVEAKFTDVWGQGGEKLEADAAFAAGDHYATRTMQGLLFSLAPGNHVDMLMGMLSAILEAFWAARDEAQPPEIIRAKMETMCRSMIEGCRAEVEIQRTVQTQ